MRRKEEERCDVQPYEERRCTVSRKTPEECSVELRSAPGGTVRRFDGTTHLPSPDPEPPVLVTRRLPALVSLALVAACASSPGPGAAPTPTSTAPSEPDSRLAELEAIYRARADSALLEVHPTDVAFMRGMIAHHTQALRMSELAPRNGAGPQIRTLAARIINAQKDEISVMEGWLRDRGEPLPTLGPGGHMEGHDAAGHDADSGAMPGMLTMEQLRELDEARGEAFDRLFLRSMIQHHNGAVRMVHALFDTDGAAQDDLVFKLASDIQVDQITEVARMESMLEALDDPGPAGGPGLDPEPQDLQ